MEYRIYFNKTAFPVTTDKITIKHPGRNKSLDLISEGEVNALRARGLREVTLDLVLPAEKRPYAYYAGKFHGPKWYLDKIEKLAGKSFRLIIIRTLKKDGRDDAFDVTIEDYDVIDDVDEGRDVTVRLELKEYKDYGVKKVTVSTATSKKAAAQDLNNKNMSIQQTNTAKARTPKKSRDSQYTTKQGDKLTAIAKKYYGSKDATSAAKLLFKLNKSTLKKKSPNTKTYSKAITKGVTLKVPQTLADLKKAVK